MWTRNARGAMDDITEEAGSSRAALREPHGFAAAQARVVSPEVRMAHLARHDPA